MNKQKNDKNKDINGKGSDKKTKKQPTIKTRKEGKKSRNLVDVFNECAMDNAYHTCHNVQDLLKCRGFPWPQAQKKKKKNAAKKNKNGLVKSE